MIDHDVFLKWAEQHFPAVVCAGDEVKIDSVFAEDNKQHCWCNPSKNAFHCWKSGKTGNLFALASEVTGCSYQEAVALLSDDNDLRALEERLERFFADKYEPKEMPPAQLELPQNTFLISKMSKASHFRQKAEAYLNSRQMPVDKMMVCISGKYYNRIIIPYYGPDGALIYWNGRTLGDSKSKYMGPDANTGIGKSDVIFMDSWPQKGERIYLTEGEFDAISLTKSGLPGAACGGKEVGLKQIDLIRSYKVCISFDTDKSGAEALNKIGDRLISNGIHEVCFVRPPDKYKDWNEMLIDLGEKIVGAYVITQEKKFTPWTSTTLRLNNR